MVSPEIIHFSKHVRYFSSETTWSDIRVFCFHCDSERAVSLILPRAPRGVLQKPEARFIAKEIEERFVKIKGWGEKLRFIRSYERATDKESFRKR